MFRVAQIWPWDGFQGINTLTPGLDCPLLSEKVNVWSCREKWSVIKRWIYLESFPTSLNNVPWNNQARWIHLTLPNNEELEDRNRALRWMDTDVKVEEPKTDRKMSTRSSSDAIKQRSSHTGKVSSAWEDWQSCESQQMGSDAKW